MRWTEVQQFLHTQPSSGISRIASHTAHAGASNADTSAFAAVLKNNGLDMLRIQRNMSALV
jgi:hypothetical protein